MALSLPSSACAGVPPSGASMKWTLSAFNSAASASVEAGSTVEQSTMIKPSCAPAFNPSGPRTSASTCVDPVTQRKMTSDARATSAGVFTSFAPRLTRSSTGARLRWPMMVRGNPFSTMFFAMPWPMRPTPMKPARSLVLICHLSD